MHWLFSTLDLAVQDSNKVKSVEEVIADVKHVINSINEVHAKLSHPCFSKKPFDELETRQKVLKVCAEKRRYGVKNK